MAMTDTGGEFLGMFAREPGPSVTMVRRHHDRLVMAPMRELGHVATSPLPWRHMHAVDYPMFRSGILHPRQRGGPRVDRQSGAALWHQHPSALQRLAGPGGGGR